MSTRQKRGLSVKRNRGGCKRGQMQPGASVRGVKCNPGGCKSRPGGHRRLPCSSSWTQTVGAVNMAPLRTA